MKMIIHVLTLVIGLGLICYGGIGLARPIAVWSDFKAFFACVASDESARHALAYGGEKAGTDFDYLLQRVWRLSDDWKPVIWTGMLLCAVGVVGIVCEVQARRKRIIEPHGGG